MHRDAPIPTPLPDPIIEEYKKHLDVSMLIENLKRTPEQRIDAVMAMNELVEEMQRAKRERGSVR